MKTAKDGTYYKNEKEGLFCWRIKVGGRSIVRKAKTQKELKRRVTEAIEAINDRGGIQTRAMRDATVGSFLAAWLEDFVRPSRAVKTYAQYEQVIRLYVAPAIGHVRLDALTSGQCQAMLGRLLDRGLSPTTVNLTRTIAKRAFNVARNQTPPLILKNPMDGTEPAKKAEQRKRTLDDAQIQALLAAAFASKTITRRDGIRETVLVNRYGPLLAFLLVTGLRISEANGLAWEDIDLSASPRPVVRVRRKLTWTRGGSWILETPKTTRSMRGVPLADAAVQALDVWRSVQGRDRYRAGANWAATGLVWTTEGGRPIKPRNVQRAFSELLAAAGLPHFGLHDLRRSFGTHLARQLVPAHILQALMGHESITTTMAHYVTAFAGDMARAMDAFQGLGQASLPPPSPPA